MGNQAVKEHAPMRDLETLGWDDDWAAAFAPYHEQGLIPGRVAVQHRGEYDVVTADGGAPRRITSRLRRESDRADLPVVGDWVALDSRRHRRRRPAANDDLPSRRTRAGIRRLARAGDRCQRRHRVRRAGARPGARPPPARALPRARRRERGAPGRAAHESRSRSRILPRSRRSSPTSAERFRSTSCRRVRAWGSKPCALCST